MEALYCQAVFSVGNERYCWGDVVLAAELSGEWDRVRERARQGIACIRACEDGAEGPTDEEVESAATEFRQSRDLVSAEEMEGWLDRWNLTVENWMDYVRSSLLRQKLSADLGDLTAKYPAAQSDLDHLVHVEAVCSGDLERFAEDLAGRAAVGEKKDSPTEPEDARVSEALSRFPTGLADRGLPGVSPEALRAKMERLAHLDVSFARFRRQVVTPRSAAAMIRSRRLDWTRVGLDSISFPEEQMAREAALCVREDGRNLREVAADAGRELTRSTKFVEEIEPAVRDGLLGAQKGEVLGPFREQDDFVVYQLVDKTLPSARDAALAERAQQAVLRLHLEREINDRVKWARPT